MSRWIWPLRGCIPLLPDAPGSFGFSRKNDIHTGFDLYCELGTPVLAVEAGTVVKALPFTGTGTEPPTTWWNDTDALLIEGTTGVVLYGEIEPLVQEGDKVAQGQQIAIVKQAVLRRYKGRPMVMLHLELMRAGCYTSPWWYHGENQPAEFLSPEPLLKEAAGEALQIFNLATYDGISFRAPETFQA